MTYEVDPHAAIRYRHFTGPVQLDQIVSVRIEALSKDVTIRLDMLDRTAKDKMPMPNQARLEGTVLLPASLNPEDVIIHADPFGGLEKPVGESRLDAEQHFLIEGLPEGRYEIWAETRSDSGTLFTGACAASTLETDKAAPWSTYSPPTKLPRARRSPLNDCKKGAIRLLYSAEYDKKKNSRNSKPKGPAAKLPPHE
jgi:hypothetical protein